MLFLAVFAISIPMDSLSASADEIGCKTESAGQSFNFSDRDPIQARGAIFENCYNGKKTNAQECLHKVSCSDGFRGANAAPMITCISRSQGKYFIRKHLEFLLARSKSIQACGTGPHTIRNDCEHQVMCYQEPSTDDPLTSSAPPTP